GLGERSGIATKVERSGPEFDGVPLIDLCHVLGRQPPSRSIDPATATFTISRRSPRSSSPYSRTGSPGIRLGCGAFGVGTRRVAGISARSPLLSSAHEAGVVTAQDQCADAAAGFIC